MERTSWPSDSQYLWKVSVIVDRREYFSRKVSLRSRPLSPTKGKRSPPKKLYVPSQWPTTVAGVITVVCRQPRRLARLITGSLTSGYLFTLLQWPLVTSTPTYLSSGYHDLNHTHRVNSQPRLTCIWPSGSGVVVSVQDWSLQCPSNVIWPFKIYPSQNNLSKCNPKSKMKMSLEVLNIIFPPQESTSIILHIVLEGNMWYHIFHVQV